MTKESADELNRWGDCNSELGRIRIYTGERPADAVAEVLIHEVLHALFRDTGLQWDDDDEERFVEHFSPRLAAFMADNPDAIRALLDMLADQTDA